LKQIYESEGPKLYGYLVKKAGAELAQDIMQEAFTRLFDRLKKAAITNTRAYLFQIARHLLYHESAFARRFGGSEAHLENAAAPVTAEGKDGLEQAELLAVLNQAVGTLSPAEREIFEMRWYMGLTQVEIADALKKSERQIRRDLEKIVTRLRACFTDKGWGNAEGLKV
jgi:RNA polymerase sigma-70 factor (ECF subfamily)